MPATRRSAQCLPLLSGDSGYLGQRGADCAIVRHYRKTVMVDLQFDRIEGFIGNNNYMQHASKVGDGIARLKYCWRREGRRKALSHAAHVCRRGKFRACFNRRGSSGRAHGSLRPVSIERQNDCRALGRADAKAASRSVAQYEQPVLTCGWSSL